MKKLRVFESFAGIGSYRMALNNINCNYEIVGISEVDKNAILCYDAIHNEQIDVPIATKEEMIKEINKKHIAYNFSNDKPEIPVGIKKIKKLYDAHIRCNNYGDIRLINEKKIPDFDLFLISSPCKTISRCGLRTGFKKNTKTQSSLLWECERIIKEKKPRYILLENVKNIIGNENIDTFNEWCLTLENIGYINHWDILNGANFNIPQARERMMMFSVLKEYDNGQNMPTGTLTNLKLKDILEENVDDNFFIDNKYVLKFKKTSSREDIEFDYPRVLRLGGIFDVERTKRQVGSVYSYKNLCPTLDTMLGGYRQPIIPVYGETFSLRKLTPLECWRLMGYKDEDYYKCKDIGISNTRLYERAGRGIVVPMLEEIFKTYLGEYIRE